MTSIVDNIRYNQCNYSINNFCKYWISYINEPIYFEIDI